MARGSPSGCATARASTSGVCRSTAAKLTKLTDFDNVPLRAFEISPDGKRLFFTKGVESSDAVLIENFR